MWLMTRVGFFSIVEKDGEQHLTIRSSHREDLDRLRDHYLPGLSATTSHPDSAYPWRATAPQEAVGQALAKLAADIDYPAVQEELVHSLGPQRANAYGKAGALMAPADLTAPPSTDGSDADARRDAALASLPTLALPMAQREDWKTRPMPARKASVDIPATTGRPYTDAEMARIRCGFIPSEMEDKWFVFFEGGVLHLHRSWTGICIYRASFDRLADGWRVTHVEVNLHPHEHRLTDADDQAGIARFFKLLDGLASGAWDASQEEVLVVTSTGPTLRDRFLGCLLGGAVGDALGAPVEFLSRAEILRRFGPEGITAYAPAYGGLGTITDDTQMTLFTAEGLLRAYVRGCFKGITTYPGVVAHAYLRWLQTQSEQPAPDLLIGHDEPGWLFGQRALHARRAPGNTCLSALRAMRSLGVPADNDSKGCGGVMRVAPVGLFAHRLGQSPQLTFELGTELAALTHGHPTGALTGGVFAVLVLALCGGASLPDALATAKICLRDAPHHRETLEAIEAAEFLATRGRPHEDAIAQLGEGWVAEEALAIAIYCALVATDVAHGIVLAVNHDGDSDSTGAMVGNLLGAMHGVQAIPQAWRDALELRETIAEIAADLHDFRDWNIGEYSTDPDMNERIWARYPGY